MKHSKILLYNFSVNTNLEQCPKPLTLHAKQVSIRRFKSKYTKMAFFTTWLIFGLSSTYVSVLQQPFNPVLSGVNVFTHVTGIPLTFFSRETSKV